MKGIDSEKKKVQHLKNGRVGFTAESQAINRCNIS